MAALPEILDQLPSNTTATDRDLIARAYAFAEQAHAGQFRKNGDPYFTHASATGLLLAEWQMPATMVAAGLLHDVPEDTVHSIEDLHRAFGREIADIVEGETKLSKLQYHGNERFVENLRKMFVAMGKDIRVIGVKFADRVDNLRTLDALVPEKRRRIALESLEIHVPVANRLGMYEIKAQLEDLAFPHVYPEEAQWLDDLLSSAVAQHSHVVGEIHDAAAELLRAHRIEPVGIEGRQKSRYRLYQKLLEHNRDITKIYDILALRVVVGDIADCYTVLGLLHQRWKPLKGRIKDYIANPKPNGYRSIHTTMQCAHGSVFEFQIRTPEMHEDAEWGAASAWRYHERGPTKPSPRQLRWVNELIQWQRSIRDPKAFLEGLKYEVLRDRILVFTPKGDVIELPEGATPIDFAYAIHTNIGNHTIGARVNGTSALHPLDRALQRGDMVEILVDPKRSGPNPDWLSFVRTVRAREKIRDALRGTLRTTVASWVGQATARKR